MTTVKVFMYPEKVRMLGKGDEVSYFKSHSMSFQQVQTIECNIDIKDIVEMTDSTIKIKAE